MATATPKPIGSIRQKPALKAGQTKPVSKPSSVLGKKTKEQKRGLPASKKEQSAKTAADAAVAKADAAKKLADDTAASTRK
jgi:hypothetical protein